MRSEALPNRQSIRKRGWDYTASGYYFVTCNTRKNRALFGVIVNGRMVLNEAGRVAEEEWHKSSAVRDSIELDEFVVMPNHVHGIVRLRRAGPHGRPAGRPAGRPYSGPPPGSLGAFVAGFKGAVGRRINAMQGTPGEAIWHRNYWDVIVRDDRALANIRRYIRMNPQNYAAVEDAGEPRFLGNRALLERPLVGFLASRGASAEYGTLSVRSGEVVLSGFLSPMERALFRAGLRGGRPMVWVRPWGLSEGVAEPAIRRALDEGRLLVLSPFPDHLEAPSARRAVWCNQYVLAHSTRLAVGHLNPGGMLACLLSEADPDLDIIYL